MNTPHRPRVTPLRAFAALGALSGTLASLGGLWACSVASRPTSPETQHARPQAVKREGGKTLWVDTHDAYAHTGTLVPGTFPYFRRPDGRPSLGLTFDCAWVNEANGMAILNFLKARGIRTTFFISGPFVFADWRKGLAGGLNKASLKMIRKMVEDGHEFGNHTQTHPHNSASINWERENAELKAGWDAATKELFGDALPTNARMLPFWRAPYGEYDERSLGQASRAGYPLHFGWNVDVLDAAGLPACQVDPSHPRCVSPATMTKRVVAFAEKNAWNFDGMVVLAHLQNPYGWTSSADGLAALVDTFQKKGVAIRRLSEFFNGDLAPELGIGPRSTP